MKRCACCKAKGPLVKATVVLNKKVVVAFVCRICAIWEAPLGW